VPILVLTSAEGPEVLSSQGGDVGIKDHHHPPYREALDGDVEEDFGKTFISSEGRDARRLCILKSFPLLCAD